MKSLLLIILLLFISVNNAYRHREIVRVNLQTKVGTSSNIEYHDLSPRLAPKFKVDVSKSLLDLETNKKVEILPDVLYRILFSFDQERFKTTWITLSDGNGKYLNHIDFIFIYSNDKIIDLKWNLDYNDEEVHHGKKPTNFYINYRWEEIKDKDLSSGLFILFSVGLVFSSISFTYITLSFASKPSKIKNLPSFYQKAKTDSNINNNSYNNNVNNNFRQQQSHQYNTSGINRFNYNNNNNYTQQQQPQQEQYYQSSPQVNNNNENENSVQPLSSYDTSPSYHLSPPPTSNDNDDEIATNNIENSNNGLDVSDSEIETFVELNRSK